MELINDGRLRAEIVVSSPERSRPPLQTSCGHRIRTAAQQIIKLPVAAFYVIGPPFPPRNWYWGRRRILLWWPRALAVVREEIHAGLPQDEPAGSGRTARGTAN